MDNSEKQLIRNFRGVLRQFEREIFIQNNESCCNGVTLAQCHTLLEVESKGKESITELSKTMGLDKSTISRTVEGLVGIGLVDRSIPAENRRMAAVQLTKTGKKTCDSINSNNDKYFDEVLSILSVSEKNELIRLLDIVTRRMVQLRSEEKDCCK